MSVLHPSKVKLMQMTVVTRTVVDTDKNIRDVCKGWILNITKHYTQINITYKLKEINKYVCI